MGNGCECLEKAHTPLKTCIHVDVQGEFRRTFFIATFKIMTKN